MKRLVSVLVAAILVLAVVSPSIALGKPVLKTSGSTTGQGRYPGAENDYVYTFKWSATEDSEGVVRGQLTLTMKKVLESGRLELESSTTWPITSMEELTDGGIQFSAPDSDNWNWEWGGEVWRAYDGGKTGDEFKSYCAMCSTELGVETWHSIGTPKISNR